MQHRRDTNYRLLAKRRGKEATGVPGVPGDEMGDRSSGRKRQETEGNMHRAGYGMKERGDRNALNATGRGESLLCK